MYSIDDISKKVNNLISTYSQIYVGREKLFRLLSLSLMTRHHIYIIGPPGTGKTLLMNVAEDIGFDTFYYLFTYDTKITDILADPVIQRKALEDGEIISTEYSLKPRGIGSAEVILMDELFKAPGPVLNAMLGVLNERRVALGSQTYKLPLWSAIAASNEIPSEEDLQAFIDRFLYRSFVDYLPNEKLTEYVISYWAIHTSPTTVNINIDKQVFKDAYQHIKTIDVFTIINDYLKIIADIRERGIQISDRRIGRILYAMAASAILDGRSYVDPTDLEVLLYTVPKDRDEYEAVAKIVDEHLGSLLSVKEELRKHLEYIDSVDRRMRNMDIKEMIEALEKIAYIKSYIIKVDSPSLSRYVEKVQKRIEEFNIQAVEAVADRLIEESGINLVKRDVSMGHSR